MTEKNDLVGLTKNRIEALTDGVFAIAMTLIVFSIKVPDLPEHPSAGELSKSLLAMWPSFLTYVISFAVLGIYWIGHHNHFCFIRRVDRKSMWINMAFLCAITLIPFSTALLARYPDQRIAVIVYGANFILVGMTLYAHFWYAVGPGHLLDKEMEPRYRHVAQKLILSGPVASIICIVIAFGHPLIASTLFVLIPIFYIVPRSIDRQFAAVLRSIQRDS